MSQPDKSSPSDSPTRWVAIARLLRPQGRKGELLSDLLTDLELDTQFRAGRLISLAKPEAFAPTSMPIALEGHWLPVGKNAGRIVLHFAGIDSIEKAERLAGKEVIVPLTERLPLETGAAYISDLVGSTVYDRDVALGVVESVQFPTSSDGTRRLEEAAPLLAITSPEGDEILIPFASAFLLELDLAGKSIRMALPEGLTEINRTHPATDD